MSLARFLRGAVLAPALFSAVLAAPLPAAAADVVVFAAASMKNALDDFAARWQAETGDKVTVSYAGSGKLAQQILQGAPADVYVSANVGWMDEVEKAGLIARDGRKDILGNSLVLIAHGATTEPVDIHSGFDLADRLGDHKLAMALVNSVPAGKYGKAALTSLGIWGAVEPKVAQADNVRAALALVSTGEAPYGIVYSTDAEADKGVSVAGTFPADSHPPIIYPAALLKDAADPADRAFYDALSSDMAAKVFKTYGFTVLPRGE
ncbi:molybdate ABC transporter substrate-binding protein [Acidimangrovimonas pyrenivorans]|uniref:Molybdate ABC transporter substrate-binding protein n=1 Tax=Acidimangrovimonas pyrenivorans TaxID=2030798 RepID=A0ABV7AIA9_9RHOB